MSVRVNRPRDNGSGDDQIRHVPRSDRSILRSVADVAGERCDEVQSIARTVCKIARRVAQLATEVATAVARRRIIAASAAAAATMTASNHTTNAAQ